MMHEQQKAHGRECASAMQGIRPPLPLAAPTEEAAAEQLLSAEDMLRACPRLESAKCSCAEVLHAV
jgi:hypothetical protein